MLHSVYKDCNLKKHVTTNTGEKAYKCELRNNASTQNSHLDKKNTKKIQENNGTRVNCVKALYRLWQRVTMEVLLLRDVTHLLLKRSVLMKMSWLQQRTCEAWRCPQCHTMYGITSSFNQNQFTGGQETIAAGINPFFRELTGCGIFDEMFESAKKSWNIVFITMIFNKRHLLTYLKFILWFVSNFISATLIQ